MATAAASSAAKRGQTLICNKKRRKNSTDSLGDILLDLMHYALLTHSPTYFESELQWARLEFEHMVKEQA